MGGDVSKLTGDPQFVDGIRSLAIGLGKFFEELYPAQTARPGTRQPGRRRTAKKAIRLFVNRRS